MPSTSQEANRKGLMSFTWHLNYLKGKGQNVLCVLQLRFDRDTAYSNLFVLETCTEYELEDTVTWWGD